jgi:hypothetical protein
LTNTEQELRVDLTDFAGDKAYALFSTFRVGDESRKYQLTVSEYSGTAGISVPSNCFTLNKKKHLYLHQSDTDVCI